MTEIASMTLPELAAYIASHLKTHNIPVVLVGGSCVAIYAIDQCNTV